MVSLAVLGLLAGALSGPPAQAQGPTQAPLQTATHRAAVVSGRIQLAPGMTVRNARIAVLNTKGKRIARRGTVGKAGVFHLRTKGLPKTFILKATKGTYLDVDGRWRKTNGPVMAPVTLTKGTDQVQMVSLGTTVQAAFILAKNASPKKAAKRTKKALGWPSWTSLGRDDRVNRQYASPKIVSAKVRRLGLSGLTARSTSAKYVRVYTKSSILQPLRMNQSKKVMAKIGKHPGLLGGSGCSLESLTSATSAIGCAASMGFALFKYITTPDIAAQLAQIMAQMQSDYTELNSQLSSLSTQVQAVMNLIAQDTYTTAVEQTSGITGGITNMMDSLEILSADVCAPVSPPTSTQPAPCGSMTYTLNSVTTGLDPSTSTNATSQTSINALADDVLGQVGTGGILGLGWQSISTAATAGKSSALTGSVATSLITNSMGAQQQVLQQQWQNIVYQQALLVANWFNEANGCVPNSSGQVPAANCAQTIQTLNGAANTGRCGAGLTPAAPPCQDSLIATLNEIGLSTPAVIPATAVIDPSTGLAWWNPAGGGVTNACNDAAGYLADYIGVIVNSGGDLAATCPDWQDVSVGFSGVGAGPDCVAGGSACTGLVSDKWALPQIQYTVVGGDDTLEGTCSPYITSAAFGPTPTSSNLTGPGAPGLLNAIEDSVGFGSPQQSLATVAPKVFPLGAGSDGVSGAEVGPLGTWPQKNCTLQTTSGSNTYLLVTFTINGQNGQPGLGPAPQNFTQPNSCTSKGYTTANGYIVWNCQKTGSSEMGYKYNWYLTVGCTAPSGISCGGVLGNYPGAWTGAGVLESFLPNSMLPVPTLDVAFNYFLSENGLSPAGAAALPVLTTPVNPACFAFPFPEPAAQAGKPLCPDTPTSPTITAASSTAPGQVTLTFGNSALPMQTVNEYVVEYSADGGPWVAAPNSTVTAGTSTSTASVVGLISGQAYSFRVLGVSPQGLPSVPAQVTGTVTAS